MTDDVPPALEAQLRCPRTRSALRREGDFYVSVEGNHRYPIVHGVPVLLATQTDKTLWVADASVKSAVANPEDEFHQETLGLSADERAELKARLAAHRQVPEPLDPVVSFMVGATSGYMYTEQVGRMTAAPIPELRLPKGHGEVLLDIGCNWGRWSIAAAQRGYTAVGMDPSLGAVLAAKRLSRSMGVNANFVVGDALHLPFAQDTFDVIFSYSVLQHFSNEQAAAAIAEAARVSKTDAKLFIQMANRFGIRSLYHQLRRQFREPHEFDVRYYSPSGLKTLFATHYGPSELSVDGFFGLGMQPSDHTQLPAHKQLILTVAELFRRGSDWIQPLLLAADSLYVTSRKAR